MTFDNKDVPANEYPEMGKASLMSDQFDICYSFILWMADEKGISLAVHKGDRMVPCMETTDSILFQFFGIDKDKLTEERLKAIEDYKQYVAQEAAQSNLEAGVSGAV